jgi:uroporphyrinogen decarboxylase
MVDLASNERFANYLMDKMVEIHTENLKRYIDAVGDYIQIIQMGDDMGTQTGPQLSPELYRKMIKPRQKKVYQFVKEHSNIFVFLHSCGSIYKLLRDIIEAGVDIVNPVQTAAVDMDPVRLKTEFGKNITFWGGGCDTQRILPRGTPDDVRKEVEMKIRIFAPGGGYIFNQIHNVQADVPPENVAAMFDTAKECRSYRGGVL